MTMTLEELLKEAMEYLQRYHPRYSWVDMISSAEEAYRYNPYVTLSLPFDSMMLISPLAGQAPYTLLSGIILGETFMNL